MAQEIRVCSLESRRAGEMTSLIQRMGGVPFVAPSMREVPLSENGHVLEFAEKLLANKFQVIIFMTGVGARGMLEVLETRYKREEIFAELNKRVIIVRGPKPTAVLREWGVKIDHRAPEPNTWRELVQMLDAEVVQISGKELILQEYGKPNQRLEVELKERGAIVTTVAVYQWALPEDISLLQEAIRKICTREFDLIMFTSAQQLYHLLQVGADLGLSAELLAGLNEIKVASIGPTCTEALQEHGIPILLEPSHPKMGHLVKESLEKMRGMEM